MARAKHHADTNIADIVNSFHMLLFCCGDSVIPWFRDSVIPWFYFLFKSYYLNGICICCIFMETQLYKQKINKKYNEKIYLIKYVHM